MKLSNRVIERDLALAIQSFSHGWRTCVLLHDYILGVQGLIRGSIILTSNKSYGDWGPIFGDSIIATATFDGHQPDLNTLAGTPRKETSEPIALMLVQQRSMAANEIGLHLFISPTDEV